MQDAERRKSEEKAKKEAILQEYQLRKAEEEIPPEMRAHFRQRHAKRSGNDRPASIHWSGKRLFFLDVTLRFSLTFKWLGNVSTILA